jgi:diaminohydroxyphosphoribosylaminopyrimidine deaminase / 5-amino-6-(5-phosphoribosylamino)uracil reductase
LREDPEVDRSMMTEALNLARLGEGTTSPNPMVGALVVSGGRILGRGFHKRPGTPHAEALALAAAGPAARGATLFVTLEPCDHWGRMPPCTQAIIAAGIARVVAAMEDPDAQVRGRGFQRLREAGVEVRVGVAADAARRLNEAYITHRTTGRPFVTCKWAMTLDGRIATRSGDARWISGPASRQLAHARRTAADAIVVGIGTVLRDDPQLTARDLPDGRRAERQPARVVLDSTLRIPLSARVLAPDGAGVLIGTTSRAGRAARDRLEAAGAELIVADGGDGRVDLRALFLELGRRGKTSVLVEGGGIVHGACFDAGIVDKVLAFVAPLVVGGDGPAPAGGRGVDCIAGAWRLTNVSSIALDEDVVVEGYVTAGRLTPVGVGEAAPGGRHGVQAPREADRDVHRDR